MSTPRVGSSRSSSRGSVLSARAMMIFCCMPPLNSSRSGSCSRSPGRPRLSAILTAWSPAVSADQRKPRCRPSWLSSRFSMTERSGTMPWRRRSSPTKPTPALRASSAARGRKGLPSNSIEPLSMGRRPKMASAASLRPDPTNPPRPRISPGAISKLTSFTRGSTERWATRRTGLPPCFAGPTRWRA